VLRVSIKSWSRFVKDKNLWFSNESSCNSNSLLLTSGKLNSLLTDFSIVDQWENIFIVKEIVRISLSTSFINNRFIWNISETVNNVFSDCSREQNRLLLNNGKVLLELSRIQIFEILISILNCTDIRIIKSFNKLNNCRLSTSTSSNECDGFILWDRDINTFNDFDFLLSWVSELDLRQGDSSILQRLWSNSISFVCQHLRFIQKDLSDSWSSSNHTKNFSNNTSKHSEVDQECEKIELEWSKLTNSDVTWAIQECSKPYQDSHGAKLN